MLLIITRVYLGSSKKTKHDDVGIKLGLEERKAKVKVHSESRTLVPFKDEQVFLFSMWILSGM